MLVYHVDRTGQLTAGALLDRQRVALARPMHALELWRLDRDFPHGVTGFGVRHLFERAFVNQDGNTEQEIELIFELVRRLERPSLPSRLSCLFAVERLDDARRLADEWRADWPALQIVELEAQHASSHDKSLVTEGLAGSAWDVLERARAYWRGDASDEPDFELLVEPPATVRAIAT